MTGVPFSEHAQPHFNVELKQQIDGFLSRHRPLLNHGEFTSSLGQTLGSATEIAMHYKISGECMSIQYVYIYIPRADSRGFG